MPQGQFDDYEHARSAEHFASLDHENPLIRRAQAEAEDVLALDAAFQQIIDANPVWREQVTVGAAKAVVAWEQFNELEAARNRPVFEPAKEETIVIGSESAFRRRAAKVARIPRNVGSLVIEGLRIMGDPYADRYRDSNIPPPSTPWRPF